MELLDTVQLMLSNDYKERFLGEYWQTKIRYDKLKAMCRKWDNGELDFEPTCDMAVYGSQLIAMYDYLKILELRAEIEGIEL